MPRPQAGRVREWNKGDRLTADRLNDVVSAVNQGRKFTGSRPARYIDPEGRGGGGGAVAVQVMSTTGVSVDANGNETYTAYATTGLPRVTATGTEYDLDETTVYELRQELGKMLSIPQYVQIHGVYDDGILLTRSEPDSPNFAQPDYQS